MSREPSRTYLDWNATTPPLEDVIRAMKNAATSAWGNPESVHADGRKARAIVEDARQQVAALAGCDARDVILTSGGTEANNIAVRSAFASKTGTIFTSRLEHPSITKVAEALEREGRARVRWIAVEPRGTIDLADLERALADHPAEEAALVCVQAVNQETGAIQPAREAADLAHARGALVHVDAVQAWGKIEGTWDFADTRTLAAHKIRGPKGIGALIAKEGTKIYPVLLGGAQERGLRPGTTDPVAAAGLTIAAKNARISHVQYMQIAQRRDAFERSLVDLGGVPVTDAARAPHVSQTTWEGWPAVELVAALDLEGVAVSAGSACSAGTTEPSPVLVAMFGDGTRASSGVRASLGPATTYAEIERAVAAFRRVLDRARAMTDRPPHGHQ